MADSDMRTVYHYTTEAGAVGIHKSQVIKASPGGLGSGVYLTSLAPEVGRKKLAQNMYSNAWEQREDAGHVNRAIELRIPRSKLHHVDSKNRDIYIYKKDLLLSSYIVAVRWLDR